MISILDNRFQTYYTRFYRIQLFTHTILSKPVASPRWLYDIVETDIILNWKSHDYTDGANNNFLFYSSRCMKLNQEYIKINCDWHLYKDGVIYDLFAEYKYVYYIQRKYIVTEENYTGNPAHAAIF